LLTAEQKLKQAETAYHRLMTGTSVRVYVDQNGERMEYTAMNKGDLFVYIQQLRSEVGGPAAAVSRSIPRPMRFLF
jgi:hypothetical protein